MRRINPISILSTCCITVLSPLIATADQSPQLANDEIPETMEQHLTPPDGAAKQRLQETSNLNNLQVHQFGERTVITGMVVNRQDVRVTGLRADAAGIQISVQSGGGSGGQPTVNDMDNSKLKVQGAGKLVNVNVSTVNTGNISASASGASSEANAAGTLINVQGAVAVSVRANTVNQGNISAEARGTSQAIANASGTQIKVQGAMFTQVGGSHISQGNISATATAGTATPRKGATAALDRSK